MEDPNKDQSTPAQAAGDPQKEYMKEKISMGTVKTSMSKSLKRFEERYPGVLSPGGTRLARKYGQGDCWGPGTYGRFQDELHQDGTSKWDSERETDFSGQN